MHESADYPELENVWQSSQLVYGSGRQVSTFTRSEMAVRSAHPPTTGLGSIRCDDRCRDLSRDFRILRAAAV
jgi:hypothetical protein